MTKPVLLFGYGNLSRGDDALGPKLLEFVECSCALNSIDILIDFQLQIEHALDLKNRELVLFIDASLACVNTSFDFAEIKPARDATFTTHAMSPAAVQSVYQSIQKQAPPPCFLLAIKGESFELGEDITANAKSNLEKACQFVRHLLSNPDPGAWRRQDNVNRAINPPQNNRWQDCPA